MFFNVLADASEENAELEAQVIDVARRTHASVLDAVGVSSILPSPVRNIADSALKTSDVFDYVKRQTARFPFWRQSFPSEKQSHPTNVTADMGFGERLIASLDGELKAHLIKICGSKRLNIGDKTDEERYERTRIHLQLMRQFIHQMIAEYEFRVSTASARRGA